MKQYLFCMVARWHFARAVSSNNQRLENCIRRVLLLYKRGEFECFFFSGDHRLQTWSCLTVKLTDRRLNDRLTATPPQLHDVALT